MPKTNVYPTPRPDQPEGADSRIEIGWDPYGWVQIATTNLQPGAKRNQDYMDPKPGDEDLPLHLRRAWQGWFVDLDRYRINELIRALRAARDKAFGRDE
jgi:hypothetical protein